MPIDQTLTVDAVRPERRNFRLPRDSSAIPKLSHSSCMGLTAFSEVV
jgi:hypothetical protein